MTAITLIDGLADILDGLTEIDQALENADARIDVQLHRAKLEGFGRYLEGLRAYSNLSDIDSPGTVEHVKTCISTIDIRIASIQERLRKLAET